MLSWSEMREMQQAQVAFGAHSLTHRDLTRLPPTEIDMEVRESKAILEDGLGTAVAAFAYPYGRYDTQSRDIVRQHFTCACSDSLGLMTATSDIYALERIDTYYLRTDALFDLVPTAFFPWYLCARNVPRRLRRAVQHAFD